MCAQGSSFQWFMGIIGGSTRANKPNRRCRGGRLLGSTCGIIEKKKHGWVLIRVWALNRDNIVLLFMTNVKMGGFFRLNFVYQF